MNEAVEDFLNDVWSEITAIYAKENTRINELKDQSSLQSGIMNYLQIAWRKGKFAWANGNIHVDVYEPFSWSDDSYRIEPGSYIMELSDKLLAEQFFPALCERVEELLLSDELGPRFFDYKFEIVFEFEWETSKTTLSKKLIHPTKLTQLRKTLDHFIKTKIVSDLPALPKENDLFFFAYHLVNPDLTKQKVEEIEPLIHRLSYKLKANQERKNDWVRQYTRAFSQWAEEHYLPQYFVRSEDWERNWALKEGQRHLTEDNEELNFFLYAALQIGFTEPNTRQKFLELAVQLGSKRAADYLKIGSGKFESTYRGERIEARNNDIMQTIEIHILSEEEAAYGEALNYIIQLLRENFPKGYNLKLKSSQKHYLPLKKLAKSKLHQLFSTALSYPNLFPKLAEYADTAMEEFAWYNDVEPGEKSVMPGTYAVLGLGLYSEAYFPLVRRYMELVDTEHQMAQDSYAQAFIEVHGVQEEHMPVIVSILLGGNEEGRQVKNLTIDRPELADALVQVLKDKEPHERELVICRIFGSVKKLTAAAKKADSPLKESLEELVAQPY